MLNSINVRPLIKSESHPSFPTLKKEEKAKPLHRLLLNLAKDESEKDLKSVYRQTADFLREEFFGKTDAQVRTAITTVLEDYFGGEYFVALELENLAEQTGIKAETLLPILRQMVSEKQILEGRRRNEPGKHFNPIYKLNK